MSEPQYIDRPPRIQPDLPQGKVEIPAAPQKPDDTASILMQVALPLVTIIGFVVVAALGSRGGGSAMLVLPMFLSVIAAGAFAWYMHQRQERARRRQEAAYRERLLELRQEMLDSHKAQRRFYHYNYPDTATILRIAEDTQRESGERQATIRSGSRLWERRPEDEDFASVRLGLGTIPSTTLYEFSHGESFESDLTREAMRLDADSRFVAETPVTIGLRPPPPANEDNPADGAKPEAPPRPMPIAHAIGVAGQAETTYRFAWALLAHYVTFHAAPDARLFILGPERRPWEWAYSLAHSRPDDQNDYLCFEEMSEEADADEDGEGALHRYLEGLRRALAQRELRLKETDHTSGDGHDPRRPFLLVVVDLLAPLRENSPLNQLEGDAAMSLLMNEGAALGAAVIFLVPERSRVPSGCVAVIEIEDVAAQNAADAAPYFRYAEVGVNSWRYVGRADFIADRETIGRFAHRLEALDARKTYGGSLATSVPFMEMMSETSLDTLREAARRQWQRNLEPGAADWLKVKVGLMSGNKPRTLVFSAKKDGVHGMVAGSTGSGKSELLISMIAGLAVTYDPATLNFVLVDYKGGGAFSDFEQLPHCVDIITNLQGAGVARMFTAINAELKRRQALNVRTGTKDIVEYRRRGYHLSNEPYPFLFIIIDEFAEMIAESPEFKTELERITRVGRAQGVSLILAAQRPSGVTDQMRSNIKFRICLRVEGTDESREMLRRPDAAYLPNNIPGRGYLQVGNDDIDFIQVAYTGDKYVDPSKRTRLKVIWPGRARRAAAEDKDAPKVYQAIIAMLNRLAADEALAPQQSPWPEVLPAALALAGELNSEKLAGIEHITLGRDVGSALSLNPAVNRWLNHEPAWDGIDWNRYAMRPVVGLIDDPFEARRRPLVIDMQRGHVALFGGAGWGKTTFLRTLVVSLAATHSPREVQMFILDLGGRNLQALRALPHVGAVILPDEEGYEEQVQQLLRELGHLIEKRKKLLGDEGVPQVYQYNALHPDNALPAVLVVIDNFAEFKESFERHAGRDEGPLDEFIALTRESRAYGIHFAVTAGNVAALPTKMFNIFTERLTLKLAEAAEYRTITGASVPELEDVPGRGYIKIGRQAYAFQIALPVDIRRDGVPGGDMQEIRQLAATMKEVSGELSGELAFLRVEPLPRTVSYRQMVARRNGPVPAGDFMDALRDLTRLHWNESLAAAGADWLAVNLGMTAGNQPRILKLAANYDGVHGMIAGGTGSGKSELLMTMVVDLALNYDPSILNFVLVDYKGGGAFKPFERLPHVVDTITNLQLSGVVRMFTAINAELKRRQKLNADSGTKDIIDYRRKGLHLDPLWGPYPHLVIIIDEYAEMIGTMPEFKQELESITRVGRASGVHLILAAQRPTGVTDQMRSNIKFRICLRVEGLDESREMLRRPDAAFLPGGLPGRGYLQIGNEEIELIQVGFTGEKEPQTKEAAVLWPDRPIRPAPALSRTDVPRLYDRVVSLSAELAGEATASARRPRRPWPGFLPQHLTLQIPWSVDYLDSASIDRITLGRTPGDGAPLALNPWITDWQNGEGVWPGVDWKAHALRPVVGLIDNPVEATQLPLALDFRQAHVAVFGDSGAGKTTLLRSALVSLVATHSPDELSVFILDLGGRSFNVFRPLPHVADIIMPDDEAYEERVYRLIDRLALEVERRQALLSQTDSADLIDYNAKQPDEPLPAILLIIDNFSALNEPFEGLIESDLIPLARTGRAYGIHLLLTANTPGSIPGKFYNLIGERITLRQSDVAQYFDIVGRGAVELDANPGQGYVRVGRRPLVFKTALPIGLAIDRGDTAREAELLRALVGHMAGAWRGRRLAPIAVLPKEVSLRQVLEMAAELDPTPAAVRGVLGMTAGLRPAESDLQKNGPHFVIVGPPLSGKTTVLRNWVISLALRYPPQTAPLILVDTQRKFFDYGGQRSLAELPHVLATVTEVDEFAQVVAHLRAEYAGAVAERRTQQIFVLIDNFDDIGEELSSGAHSDLSREAALLARRFGGEGLHFVVAGAMDSLNDLRRRIEAANYGLALRTGDALQKLSVMRLPGNVRDGELALGRGYIVKAGRASLVQTATPYIDLTDEAFADESGQIAAALDAWVERVLNLYPDERSAWLTPLPDETPAASREGASVWEPEPGREPASGTLGLPASPEVLKLLRRAIQVELRKQGLDAFALDDRDILDLARAMLGDGDEAAEPDSAFDDLDPEAKLDLDFTTDDILNAMEPPG